MIGLAKIYHKMSSIAGELANLSRASFESTNSTINNRYNNDVTGPSYNAMGTRLDDVNGHHGPPSFVHVESRDLSRVSFESSHVTINNRCNDHDISAPSLSRIDNSFNSQRNISDFVGMSLGPLATYLPEGKKFRKAFPLAFTSSVFQATSGSTAPPLYVSVRKKFRKLFPLAFPSSVQKSDHLKLRLADIVVATNNFTDENIIANGGFGKVYKGQLVQSAQLINIVARRLDPSHRQGSSEFRTEIWMLSQLKHEYLVSIVGFCDTEDGEQIIINKYEVNGSLDKYLSSPTLTWMQRLHICVGAARALSYIHDDKEHPYCVIHCNLKSSKILLDENWKAKLSGFGHSKITRATLRHRLVLSSPVGMPGYIDPVYMETGSVTHKSDVYSFGVILFEVLCGRNAVNRDDDGGLQYLALLATQHYEDKKLDEIIDPNLRKQMDPQSLTIFSDTAYHCLNKQRTQRPYMENVVKRLEKALEFQEKHENPLILKEQPKTPLSNYLKGKILEHLKIQLKDIVLATDNFAETYRIGFGGYGAVFKAELDHFDSKSLSIIEGKTKDELPKKRSSVAIKQIFRRQDEQGENGFFAEIDLLTSCNHRNIVSLLGFCDEKPQQILVYELASNGSLEDYLGNTDKMTTFTWKQRIKMCLDIAHGLNYLHTTMKDKERIVHRDIKSANILLYENWEAKIADFGLSRSHPASTINTYNIAGTEVYMDPEYLKTGKLKKESDIYSFGVVLFEILCGRVAYDEIYNDVGFPSIVRRCFHERRLKEIIDPKIKEEADNKFTLNRGPNQDSLDTFSKIACQCLAETQAERPSMEVVIKELEDALYFQENNKDSFKISLGDIKMATNNFSSDNCIGKGGFGKAYKGEVPLANGLNSIVAKRWESASTQGETEFLTELEILFEYKHENVIGLVGYCDEMDEKIIVYEYASRKSLDRWLQDNCLTWMKRLEICIDVARALDFLHSSTDVKQEVVIHRDIKSSNILLTGDWKAKIGDFGLSLVCPIYQEMDYVIDNVAGTYGYLDPVYKDSGVLTKESDIYSFGVVLFEILCGRILEFVKYGDSNHRLFDKLVWANKYEGRFDQEMVFEGIKEQIAPESLTTYSSIAYRCLHKKRDKRPTTSDVIIQLEKALKFQEDYEVWEPKLPADYKQIIQMSDSPASYSHEMKRDLYTMFSKGILLQEGKLWFSLDGNGERNEMVSARRFSYKNHKSHKWRSLRESRFPRVAKMVDISNLQIQIKIKTQFLSLDVMYGVQLVFKFVDPIKFSSKPMYHVNLTYKMGDETLHAYLATLREDKWMMIELYQFLNDHKEGIEFEVLLESFSRCYCGSDAIYVEGIQFQAIDKVKHEEYEKLKEMQRVLTSNSSLNCVHQLPTDSLEILKCTQYHVPDGGRIPIVDDEKLWLRKVDGKKCHLLPAKDVLYNSSNDKLFNRKPSTQSRFQEEIEVLRQQLLCIKCKIECRMLSPDTDYVCYLVFKLSEKCHGLHCPVKVKDQLHWKNKESGIIIYFRSPTPWNLHDINRIPKKREDGWMEVNVWKFNSNDGIRHDYIPIRLKLISYEGTMSGLILCGLEIRPM